MQIKALNNTAEREEVGFIHVNGALVLFPSGLCNENGPIVINSALGNYETHDDEYFVWRADAARILYRGDKVEITL